MNTLMINSRTQGIGFNEAEAVAPFAMLEKLAAMAGALLKVIGQVYEGQPATALRAAQA